MRNDFCPERYSLEEYPVTSDVKLKRLQEERKHRRCVDVFIHVFSGKEFMHVLNVHMFS